MIQDRIFRKNGSAVNKWPVLISSANVFSADKRMGEMVGIGLLVMKSFIFAIGTPLNDWNRLKMNDD